MRHWALELSLLTMCSSGDPVKLLKLQGTEVRRGVGRDAWCPKAKTRVAHEWVGFFIRYEGQGTQEFG
jgi:hypothetical protein